MGDTSAETPLADITAAPTRRLVWIDWLRVIVVLLVFAFHSARVYDTFELFYAKSSQTSAILSYVVVGFLSLWQMQLLFVLAGMSSYFALAKRTGGQFAKERALRLLVPFFFGYFVIVPPQGWFAVHTNTHYTGSLAQFYVDYFSWRWGAISDYLGGPSFGHLWFILFLFVVSMAALPLFLWVRRGRTGRGAAFGERMAKMLSRPWWWLAVAFVLLLTTSLPDLGGHNVFNFLVWFVLGFLLVAGEGAVGRMQAWRWWLLASGLVLSVVVALTYGPARQHYPDPSVPLAATEYAAQLAGLLLCLAAIGLAAAYLDRPTRALPYLAEASYPTYILHQTVIVGIGFYLVRALPQPLPSWVLLTVLSIAATYLLYELLVRRWAPMRFLFGMRPKRKSSPAVAR